MRRRASVAANVHSVQFGPTQRFREKKNGIRAPLPAVVKRYCAETSEHKSEKSELEMLTDMLTAQKYNSILQKVKSFDTKDKRKIYSIVRAKDGDIDEHTFFPTYGFTAGQYSIFDLLARNPQRNIVSAAAALEVVSKPPSKRVPKKKKTLQKKKRNRSVSTSYSLSYE